MDLVYTFLDLGQAAPLELSSVDFIESGVTTPTAHHFFVVWRRQSTVRRFCPNAYEPVFSVEGAPPQSAVCPFDKVDAGVNGIVL
jgi:hypothetical protein